MRVNSRGCIQGPGLYVFFRDHSSGEQTNKSRLRFSGAADVCLDPPNRSNSGWSVCMHVYIDKYAYVCACAGGGSACLCIAEQREEEGGGGGEGGRGCLEFCLRQSSVPRACRLQSAVVTTSKLCRKNCNSEWKSRVFQRAAAHR